MALLERLLASFRILGMSPRSKRALYAGLFYLFDQFRAESKVRIHPNSASLPSSSYDICRKIYSISRESVSTILEVGANYGQEGEYFRQFFGVKSVQVHTFEPLPDLSNYIIRNFPFLIHNEVAVGDTDGTLTINIPHSRLTSKNSGLASALSSEYSIDCSCLEVRQIRLDTYCRDRLIKKIDFLQIDVEGYAYQVLRGLGDMIQQTNFIQLESEDVAIYHNQYLFKDIQKLLSKTHQLVWLNRNGNYSDSLWAHNSLL